MRVLEEIIKRLTPLYVMSCSMPVHRIVIGIWLYIAHIYIYIYIYIYIMKKKSSYNYSLDCNLGTVLSMYLLLNIEEIFFEVL